MEKITIEQLKEGGLWKVTQGSCYSDTLDYTEMLGLVAALTMPKDRPWLHWMKTPAHHQAEADYLKKLKP